eukprot:m.51421 g.51421  ORF g.51421 m.51421 type:complete len:70 (+) comp34137_c0_seq4:30-239(+)
MRRSNRLPRFTELHWRRPGLSNTNIIIQQGTECNSGANVCANGVSHTHYSVRLPKLLSLGQVNVWIRDR